MDPDVLDLLRIGGYQLAFLSRVPAHAAVNSTVELARAGVSPRVVPFVNAVLRGMGRSGMPTPPPDDLAMTYSHPEWLVDRWCRAWGSDTTRKLLAHNNQPPAVTIYPVGSHGPDLQLALERAGIEAEPAPSGGFRVVGTAVVAELPGYDEGWFIVQDPGQRELLRFADLPASGVVWDACAAPGGKLIGLNLPRVVASDARRDRIPRLRANLDRVAHRLPLFVADAATPPLRADGVAAVLADVPCSATGTMARHPDARWRLTPDRIAWLVRLQTRILRGAAAVVQPGGLLVYLTCSLEHDENGAQIERFLQEHGDFRREGADVQILPQETGTDGGYGARLRRVK